jgi:hypothetical protein
MNVYQPRVFVEFADDPRSSRIDAEDRLPQLIGQMPALGVDGSTGPQDGTVHTAWPDESWTVIDLVTWITMLFIGETIFCKYKPVNDRVDFEG